MSFSWFLARRYLKPKRSAFSVITILSILGVMLAVAALIVVIGVMSGFERQIKEGILGLESQIILNDSGMDLPLAEEMREHVQDWRGVQRYLAQQPLVKNVGPFIHLVTLVERAPHRAEDPGLQLPPVVPDQPTPEDPPAGPDPADPPVAPDSTNSTEEPGAEAAPEGQDLSSPPDAAESAGVVDEAEAAAPAIPNISSAEEEATLAEAAEYHVEPEAAQFLAIDTGNPEQVAKLEKLMSKGSHAGTFDLSGDRIVINEQLAAKLGVQVGDKVNAFSPENMKEVRKAWAKWEKLKDQPEERKSLEDQMDRLLAPVEFEVAGLFASLPHKDHIILSIENGQLLSGKASEDWISGLAVNTHDPFKANEALHQIMGGLPPNWRGRTWIDNYKTFFDTIQNERSMMYLVLMIVMVVAAFSIMISMIIFAVQKYREIGVLRALGARTGHILRIFTFQGTVIGLIGISVGAAAGLAILEYRNDIRKFLAKFNVDIFPPELYGVPEIPAYLRTIDLVQICVPALVLCVVAPLLPALFTCTHQPAKALRGER